jgi:hypothetical protein
VVQRLRAAHQLAQAVEQLLQAQVCADAFIKRVFVQYHAASSSPAIIARSQLPLGSLGPPIRPDSGLG